MKPSKILSLFLVFIVFFVSALEPNQRIATSGEPSFGIVYGSNVYILSQGSDELYVLNTKTNTIDNTIKLEDQPVFASFFKNKIYIQHAGSNNTTIFDPLLNKVRTTAGVGYSSVSSVGVGNYLYTNNFDDSVSLINPITDLNVKTLYTRSGPASPYLFVSDNKIFFHHKTSNSISVLDTKTNTFVRNFPVGLLPQASVKHGNYLYTINSGSNDVTITDMRDYSTVYAGVGRATIQVGKNPQHIILAMNKIYVVNAGDNTISVIDLELKEVSKTIPLSSEPNTLLFRSPYIFSINQNSVTIINVDDFTNVRDIKVGNRVTGGVFVGERLYLYASADKSVDFILSTAPKVIKIVSGNPDATYKEGDILKIEIHFNQPIASGSFVKLLLNNSREITLDTIAGNIISGNYVIMTGDNTGDLTVQKINDSEVIGLYGPITKVLAIPPKNNLGDLKNIKITTNVETTTSVCSYRLCPLSKTPENSAEYREDMLCEGFVSEDQSRSKRISRIEVLNIAVNMLHGAKTPAEQYTNAYTDITAEGNSQETVSVIQTGLDNGLIFANNGAFEPTKKISRIEAYALLMRGVCMSPVEGEEDMARAIHQKAMQESITTKQWAKFRPYSVITRNEVFIVASALADWADKNGGCDKLECRK